MIEQPSTAFFRQAGPHLLRATPEEAEGRERINYVRSDSRVRLTKAKLAAIINEETQVVDGEALAEKILAKLRAAG